MSIMMVCLLDLFLCIFISLVNNFRGVWVKWGCWDMGRMGRVVRGIDDIGGERWIFWGVYLDVL